MFAFTITASRVEPRLGARFTLEETPQTQGELCLFEIKKHLIVGRWIEGWIVQPSRWIYVGEAVISCLGKIILLCAL